MGKKRRKKRKKQKKTLAKQADKYKLYQRAVQVPETEVKFFRRVFKRTYGRTPTTLREDFCGTAAVACEWVKRNKRHRAVGVDLDPEPLGWGREHNLEQLDEDARQRIELIEGDVRSVDEQKADIVAAQNFSYFIFNTRDELREYFAAARDHLEDEGLLVLDIMGGSEVIEEDRRDLRAIKGAQYIWEHKRFDPISHQCRYEIHFRFKDGSLLKAFRYDWRLWSIPEVRELLDEAGFAGSAVYWEDEDEDGDGTGTYRVRASAPADPAWICYIVAHK